MSPRTGEESLPLSSSHVSVLAIGDAWCVCVRFYGMIFEKALLWSASFAGGMVGAMGSCEHVVSSWMLLVRPIHVFVLLGTVVRVTGTL